MDSTRSESRTIKIAVIDSGIDSQHQFYKGKLEAFYSITERGIVQAQDPNDENGHGTAVAFIIDKFASSYEIRVYKAFDNTLKTNIDYLITALEHVKLWKPDIINLSLGTISSSGKAKLDTVCQDLYNSGTIIIAAASETEHIHCWPADFPYVVRVRSAAKRASDYTYCPGQPVTLETYGGTQRAAWNNGRYTIVHGNSFACAKMTGLTAALLANSPSNANVLSLLEANASECVLLPPPNRFNIADLAITNAVLFPFNKEMHSLVRFRDMLPFSINAICDFPFSKYVGQDAGTVIGTNSCGIKVESNFKELLKSSADTVILGDLSEVSSLFQRDFLAKYASLCLAANKNVVSIEIPSFPKSELIGADGNNIFVSNVDQINSSYTSAPPAIPLSSVIIAVLGTGPKTGKFTAQLLLNQCLTTIGYNVKNISTEPHGFLFGFPSIPLGNRNLLQIIPLDKQIEYLRNCIIREITDHDAEVIIIGGQSGVVPYSSNLEIGYNALSSSLVMLASQPDGVILCINPNDSASYIIRTISAIEAYGYGKVIMCVMSDLVKEKIVKDHIKYNAENRLSVDELNYRCSILEDTIGVPTIHFHASEGLLRCINILQRTFTG